MSINRNTINLWYNRFRTAIIYGNIEESKEYAKISNFPAEYEIDESYFGARRVRGKR
jgi:hypothetical protein